MAIGGPDKIRGVLRTLLLFQDSSIIDVRKVSKYPSENPFCLNIFFR